MGIARLGFSKVPPAELLALCRAIIKGLRNHPSFPNLPVSLDDFEARVNVLSAALVAARDGGKTALAARDAAVADLLPDLRLILVYCETVAKGDREMLTSANIPLVSKSSTASGDPFIRKIWRGAHPGEIAMFVKAGENADSYVMRHGVDGTDPNTWTETKIANVKSAIVIGGLTSGKRYGFQVCSLRRDGSCSAWSDSRTLMCP